MSPENDHSTPPGRGLGTTATPLFTSQQTMEADIVRGMLDAGGIEAETWSVGVTGYGNTLATFQVMVRAEDVEEAKTLIDAIAEDVSG
jgi:hypothetical protein